MARILNPFGEVVDEWNPVVAATAVVGATVDISSRKNVLLYIETALVEAVAHADGAVATPEISPDGVHWDSLASLTGTAETAGTTTINDASADIGDTTITLTDATTADFDVKLRHWFILEAVYADSESVTTLSNATHVVTLVDALKRAHTNGANVYDRVDKFVPVAIPDGAAFVRTVVNNTDADCDVAFTTRLGWLDKGD